MILRFSARRSRAQQTRSGLTKTSGGDVFEWVWAPPNKLRFRCCYSGNLARYNSKLAAKPSPVVREYDIGGTKYIVTATVKPGASEDAAAKVRRLIRKEITEMMGN